MPETWHFLFDWLLSPDEVYDRLDFSPWYEKRPSVISWMERIRGR